MIHRYVTEIWHYSPMISHPKAQPLSEKPLIDYAPQDGPDWMVVDAEGNLFVAVRDETRPGVPRLYA